MRILGYQASRFAWTPFSKTLEDEELPAEHGEVHNAVVLFMHIEITDVDEGFGRSFKKTLKHIKWMANKRDLKNIVLHSFAHLGGQSCRPEQAKQFLDALDERLANTGYQVYQTPFGWFSSWELSVFGESMAKVYKDF